MGYIGNWGKSDKNYIRLCKNCIANGKFFSLIRGHNIGH